MDKAKIREYASLMKELDLTGIEVNEKKGTIRLERSPGLPEPASTAKAGTGRVGGSPWQEDRAKAAAAGDASGFTDEEGIISPMVGVFYTSPAKDADPFVRPGDSVKKGQVVCIIESMKLMNEIQAEEDCVIGEVLVSDGEPVEYGTKLFAVTA